MRQRRIAAGLKLVALPLPNTLPARLFDDYRQAMPLLRQLQELFPGFLIGGYFRLLEQLGPFLPVECWGPGQGRLL